MSTEEEESREWTWRDIQPHIGFNLHIPRGPSPSQTGSSREEIRKRWHDLWSKKLQRHALEFHPSSQVVPQPETTDFVGFPDWYVVIWVDIVGDDIWLFREHLEEGGYHVSSISISYEPAMA